MTERKYRRLFISGGNAGGSGKSICLLLIADWLKSKNIKRAYIDADTGNHGTARSFEYLLAGQPVNRINIQDPEDLDNLFNLSAASEFDVVCDLPANAGPTGNMSSWFRDILSPDILESSGLRLITVIPVTPSPGSVQNALGWLETVGSLGTYIVALNRINYALVRQDKEILFKEWLDVEPQVLSDGYDIRHIEVEHLNGFAMKELVNARVLPSQVSNLSLLTQKRIRLWASKVHEQLDLVLP